jgi:hypothetical protein
MGSCAADDERARRKAKLMLSEKIDAAFEATARVMGGASADDIINGIDSM